jgi:putative flippase GtrA
MTKPPTPIRDAAKDASRLNRILRHLPPGQVVRYLIVGVGNTLFGYGLFALFTWLLTGIVPMAYMVACVLGNVVAITVAFLGYKWFVFKTKGNYLREYLRCYVVYGTAMLVNLALLPVLVKLAEWVVGPQAYAPYIAGAVLTAGSVLLSFVGHRHYSFARDNSTKLS